MPDVESRPRPAVHASQCGRNRPRFCVSALAAAQVIAALGLTPHPEGGFFRETFRAPAVVERRSGGAARSASTAIYFLLRAGDFSAFHTVESEEVWHYYLGASLELHTISGAGRHERVELGPAILQGEQPQWTVPANTLQAARVIGDGFGLFGCTVAPGFDFADFYLPERAELLARFPELRSVIEPFTRWAGR